MEETSKEQKKIQNATLAVALITNFSTPFAITALNIAVPHIGVEFNASTTSLTWVVLSFLLVTAILSIPFGRIADIHGRKKILISGIFIFCITSFLCIFSPNMAVFLLLRVLQGVGGAMIFATNIAILVDVFPAEKRGSVLGISVASVYVGGAAGPVIGGVITHAFGWRAIFIVITALILSALITAILRSPKTERLIETGEKLKASSFILFILSFGLFFYGVSTLMQNIWSYFIFAAGIVLIVFCVKYESGQKTPLFDVRLFKGNRLFSLSLLGAMFNYAAVFAVAYLMSLYLQLGRGMNADISGLILIFQPLLQAALSPVAGRLSDKKSPASIASIGMACCTASLVMFIFLDLNTSMAYIIAGLLLMGFGIAFFASPNSNVIYGSVGNKDYGVATSMISSARTFGQVIGMALLTLIMHIVMGVVPIADVQPSVLVQDMKVSYIVFAAICFVGVLISLQRRKK